MYAMLWRALPGGRPAKILQCLVLLGLAVTILFLWVFPAVASRLPYEQVTVQPTAEGGTRVGDPGLLATVHPSPGERFA